MILTLWSQYSVGFKSNAVILGCEPVRSGMSELLSTLAADITEIQPNIVAIAPECWFLHTGITKLSLVTLSGFSIGFIVLKKLWRHLIPG